MKPLISALIVALGELGIGTALFVCLQHSGEIRRSFFSFQATLVAASFLLLSLAGGGVRFFASVWFPPAVFALLAAWNFSEEKPVWGKSLLLVAAALGVFFLSGQTWKAAAARGSPGLALAGLAAGALLFGWANGAMILGHWYLVMRGLSFRHFQRATLQLLGMVALRAGVLAAAWVVLGGREGLAAAGMPGLAGDPLFLGMRIGWGLLLPAVFGFMAWRCARIGSNQAGTGLLYIAEVSVLIGEVLAGALGI